MADKDKVPKYDPNKEAFQMRAQWKKQDICKQQWFDRWSWLLEEREVALSEANAVRQEASAMLSRSQIGIVKEELRSLKPVPVTSNGIIGWLAARPECSLEIYTSWLNKPPIRMPNIWDTPDYMGPKKIKDS